jgi:hypothetical protein
VVSSTPEEKALSFLAREVPAWHRENHCFSCHNNGDGARALYAAARQGYPLARRALADTSHWLQRPAQWEHNHGDPGFSDQRLARLQFAMALLGGVESGQLPDRAPRRALAEAARKVAADQAPDGSWQVEPSNPLGSPVTYGTALATYAAWRLLEAANLADLQEASRSALAWLQQLPPNNIPNAAVALMTARRRPTGRQATSEASLAYLRRSQTRGGGWGPYPDAPAEPFDTALVILALTDTKAAPEEIEMLRRARRYLEGTQQSDGGWPATTRPPGGESYAQMISTTSWALLALLQTPPRQLTD